MEKPNHDTSAWYAKNMQNVRNCNQNILTINFPVWSFLRESIYIKCVCICILSPPFSVVSLQATEKMEAMTDECYIPSISLRIQTNTPILLCLKLTQIWNLCYVLLQYGTHQCGYPEFNIFMLMVSLSPFYFLSSAAVLSII